MAIEIKINDVLVQTISDTDITIMEFDDADVPAAVERRIKWLIPHKCEGSYKRFSAEGERLGVDLSVDKETRVTAITGHVDYKNRVERDAEGIA